MTDTTGAPDAQAASGTQPQAGTDDSASDQPQAGTATGAGTESEPMSLSEARKLRHENAGLRARLTTLEQADKQRADAELSELEKERKRAAELEDRDKARDVRERARALRLAALEAATVLGFRSPDIAYRLLDPSLVEWTDTDDGPVATNVEKLLRAELDKPDRAYLAKTTAPDLGGGPRGTTPSSAPGMNELIKAVVRGGS